MAEVDTAELVQMLDDQYDAYVESPDPITIGEWLLHALGVQGWLVVRPVKKPVNCGRARGRRPNSRQEK